MERDSRNGFTTRKHFGRRRMDLMGDPWKSDRRQIANRIRHFLHVLIKKHSPGRRIRLQKKRGTVDSRNDFFPGKTLQPDTLNHRSKTSGSISSNKRH